MKAINETVKVTGKVEFILRDKDGNIKLHDTIMNGITDAGFDGILARLMGAGATVFDVIGIGEDNTAFNAAQTDLIGSALYRKAGSYSHTPGTKVAVVEVSWGVGQPVASTVTIMEVGLFDNTVAGTMMSRLVRSLITKLTTDTLTIRYTITLA